MSNGVHVCQIIAFYQHNGEGGHGIVDSILHAFIRNGGLMISLLCPDRVIQV